MSQEGKVTKTDAGPWGAEFFKGDAGRALWEKMAREASGDTRKAVEDSGEAAVAGEEVKVGVPRGRPWASGRPDDLALVQPPNG
jgi:hypothetical protein